MGEDLEERLRRVEDILAIHQLFIDYGHHLDRGDVDSYAGCFTEDGELMLGPMGRAEGRDEIKAMMTPIVAGSRGASFHLITSPVVDLDGDTAKSVVMWSVINRDGDGQPRLSMLGRHEDELVRDADGRWRFRVRRGFVDIPSAMPGR